MMRETRARKEMTEEKKKKKKSIYIYYTYKTILQIQNGSCIAYMLLLSWLIIVRIIVISRMHRARRARKKKRECVRESVSVREKKEEMTMNDMTIRGRVCATRHVKFRGTSFVRQISVRADTSPFLRKLTRQLLINLSLMHCKGYSTRCIQKECARTHRVLCCVYFLINLESILIVLLITKCVVYDQERVHGFWHTLYGR